MNELVKTAQAWQDAINRNDAQELMKRSAANIEIVGPKGSAYGREVLAEWLFRAGLQLTAKRYFALDNTLVILQDAIWRDPDSEQAVGEAEVASVFGIANDLVNYYARYDTLEEAFASSGMNLQHEIKP